MSSETNTADNNARTRYWCHVCGREVDIYMAPDPTCQRCNQQFIEEIDDTSRDDPREFMNQGGEGSTTTILMDNSDNDDGIEDELFQFIRGLSGATGGTTRFHFATSTGGRRRSNSDQTNNNNNNEETTNDNDENNTNTNTNNNNNDGNPMMGGNNQMANMLQNLLSSIFDNNNRGGNNAARGTTEGNNTTSDGDNNNDGGDNENINNNNTQQQQRRTPMVIYGGLVDGGNIQFRPLNPNNRNEGGNGPTAFFQMGTNLNNSSQSADNGDNENNNNNTNNNNRPELAGMQGIFQILSAITGSPLDGGFVGNPNDYVFSQTALDNIITQLMEQTGGRSAPPPAPEDVINGLPTRKITEEEFKEQVDCAVCKDEFNLEEVVTELPCQHIFHDDCIKPWLKVNGTCPVCRHSMLPTSNDENNNNNNTNEESNTQSSTSPTTEQESTSSNINNNNNNNNNNNENNTSSSSSSNEPASTSSNSQQNTSTNNNNNNNNSSNNNNNNNNNNNTGNASPAATAFAWFTNATRSGNGTTWPTHIPAAFTWGPGNNANNNNNSNSNNSSSQQQQSDNDTPEMDLDLD